jgi:hypothetical protein
LPSVRLLPAGSQQGGTVGRRETMHRLPHFPAGKRSDETCAEGCAFVDLIDRSMEIDLCSPVAFQKSRANSVSAWRCPAFPGGR